MAPISYQEAQITVKATTVWDPYKLLGIYDHKNRGFSCVGTAETQWNSRCRWQFFGYASPPITARLDAMAACDPSEISQKSLESLARLCLCPDNHQKEAAEKAREWYDKITVFLNEGAKTAALTADVDRLKLLLQDSLDENERLEQRVEGAVKAEKTARSNEVERLFRQLKGVQADFEKHKVLKETEVDGLMKRLETSSAKLEEAVVTKFRWSREIDGLKTELERNTTLLNDAKSEALSQIDGLKKQLKESERRLKEQERTSSREIGKLDEQLKDSNERLEALKTAGSQHSKETGHWHQEVQRVSKQYDDNKIKNNARISHLQQQNDTLNAQKHFNAFRTQVHLIVKHKRLEQAESANAELTEQSERLMEQIGDMDQQLADQNRVLSSFKLRNVTRGICAVVAARPLTFSIKRVSKASRVSS